MCEFLLRLQCPLDDDLALTAIKHGHLRILRWAFARKIPFNCDSEWLYITAAEYGRLHILQWLQQAGVDMDDLDESAMEEAARNGHLQCVLWLDSNTEFHSNVVVDAAKGGQLHILEYCLQRDSTSVTDFAEDIIKSAIRSSQVNVLQWMHDKAIFPNDNDHTLIALQQKNTHILSWLKKTTISTSKQL